MNIFFIPSWYPSKKDPLAGFWTRDQALALGKHFPELKIGICTWAQGDYLTRLRKPIDSIKSIINYFHDRQHRCFLSPNVVEYRSPTIEILSQQLMFLNICLVYHACKKNYVLFEKNYGNVDLIHAHVSYPAGYIAMLLAQRNKLPYIITEHMSPFPFPIFVNAGRLSPLIRKPLQRANRIIAVSPSLSKKISGFNLPKPKFIPNIIDDSFFRPAFSTKENAQFTFLTLCRFVSQKGIPDLLRSIAIVRQTHPHIRFRIGGDPCTVEYAGLCEKLDVTGCITWLGSLDRQQVLVEYQNCDCFILASHHETFGIVYAEAIACGKPIIATKCGGPECIVNECNGVMVEPGKIQEIAGAIIGMFENRDRYNAAAIREDFLKRFSQKTVLSQIAQTYYDIVNG
jgi:glycosyltransferase involved in cell wall biosynthesis